MEVENGQENFPLLLSSGKLIFYAPFNFSNSIVHYFFYIYFFLVAPLIQVKNQMVYADNGSTAMFECEVSKVLKHRLFF